MFISLIMEKCKTCGGSGKNGSHAEYVRDEEPFSKGGCLSVGSLKSAEGIEWGQE